MDVAGARMSAVMELIDGPRVGHLARVGGVAAHDDDAPALSALVGRSERMRELRALIRRVAASSCPVLIIGPTGSGKELVARAVHAASPRAAEPLSAQNCAAIPEALLESELFGHTKGAFTGADRPRTGLVEATGRGTLFLDELGELPLALQAKLLRLLESGAYRPVGESAERQFEGRVIAATNADLGALARDGRFRWDLYYRLRVLVLRVPALDERREDIPDLVRHYAARQERPVRFSDAALRFLAAQPWPGNVRELRNVVERAAVLIDADVIEPEDLAAILEPSELDAPPTIDVQSLARTLLDLGLDEPLRLLEEELFDEALARSRGNKSAAAKLIGVHRKVVERRIGPKTRATRLGA